MRAEGEEEQKGVESKQQVEPTRSITQPMTQAQFLSWKQHKRLMAGEDGGISGETPRGVTLTPEMLALVQAITTPVLALVTEMQASRNAAANQVPVQPEATPAMLEAQKEARERQEFAIMAEMFMKMRPSFFEGLTDRDEEKAMEWKAEIRNHMRILSPNPVQMQKLAAIQLKGAARQWWDEILEYEDENTLTWDDFVLHFNRQYMSAATLIAKEHELSRIEQGENETVTEYEYRFMRLVRYTNNYLPEGHRARAFEFGLRDYLRKPIISQQIPTVRGVYDAAKMLEHDAIRVRKRRETVKTRDEGKNKRPYQAHESHGGNAKNTSGGYHATKPYGGKNDKRNRVDGNSRGLKNSVTCYRCGQMGHLSTGCDKPQVLVCFSCGEIGHKKFDCPKGNGSWAVKASNGAKPSGPSYGGPWRQRGTGHQTTGQVQVQPAGAGQLYAMPYYYLVSEPHQGVVVPLQQVAPAAALALPPPLSQGR